MSQAQTQSVAKMSKTDKEATLKTLCADGWLAQTDDAAGFLKLGSSRVPGAEGVSAGAGAGEGEGQVGEDALDERCNEV